MPKGTNFNPDKEEFLSLYEDKSLTIQQIAKFYNISQRAIIKFAAKLGRNRDKTLPMPDKNILSKMYETMSAVQIAKHFNVSDSSTVLGWLKKYNIQTRTIKDAAKLREIKFDIESAIDMYNNQKLSLEMISKKLKISRPTLKKYLKRSSIEIDSEPQKISIPDRQTLVNLYETQIKSSNQIADMYGVDKKVVLKWLYHYNIPIRSNSIGQRSRNGILALEKPSKETLEQLYTKENFSTTTLAKKFNVSWVTVCNWLKSYDIERNSGYRSLQEIEVMDYLNSLIPSRFIHTRNVLSYKKELDGYNEDLKMAIEYCGLYWHNENTGKYRNYHYQKWKECHEKGIQLITIYENEWLKRNVQVKNFLAARLGIFSRRIGARECKVSAIDPYEARNFLSDWHIQGSTNHIKHAFIMTHKDDPIGVVTFAQHHRQFKELVLNRLAFAPGIQIVGGASKIIRYALQEINRPVITWSDNRWSNGKIYETCGFVLDGKLDPDYIYTNGEDVKSKQECQKKKIGCPPDMTEVEFMAEQNWFRLWDCGKIRWRYK